MSLGTVVQHPQHRGCHSEHLTLLHTAAFRSTKIMAVFESLVGKSHLERASIDEVRCALRVFVNTRSHVLSQAYLDVTHMVEARIRSRGDGDGDGDPEDQSGAAAERPNKTRLDLPAVVARHKDWVVIGGQLRNESAMDRYRSGLSCHR